MIKNKHKKIEKKIDTINKKYTNLNTIQKKLLKSRNIKFTKLKLRIYKKSFVKKLNQLNKTLNKNQLIYNKIIEKGNYKNNEKFKEYIKLKENIDQIHNNIRKCDLLLEEINKL